jgi:hypothetical protein
LLPLRGFSLSAALKHYPRLLHRHLPDQGLQCTGTGAMDRNVLRRNNILADRPARLS